jgi:hypothetical protein
MKAALAKASSHIGSAEHQTNVNPLMEDECIVTFSQNGDAYIISLKEFDKPVRSHEVTRDSWTHRKRVLQRLWSEGKAQAQIGQGTSYKLNTKLMYNSIITSLE